MSLVKFFAAFTAMPGVNEPTRSVLLDCAADRDFHAAHFSPRNVRTSDQKSIHRLFDGAETISQSRCRLEMPVIALAALVVVPDLPDTGAAIEQRIFQSVG